MKHLVNNMRVKTKGYILEKQEEPVFVALYNYVLVNLLHAEF